MGDSRLKVIVEGLRNDDGHVLAALHDRAEAFPNGGPVRAARVAIVDRHAEIVFEDLTPGRYAVGLLHDENDNGEMDKNVLGIPKEGFGISGYERVKLEMPRFDRAAFEFDGGEQVVHVKMHYLL